jgi:hypothetical protein
MLSIEDLVSEAFEILGELLITSETAKADTTNILMKKYDIDDSIASEAVSIAFENWTEIYGLGM